MSARLRVGLACRQNVRDRYVTDADLARLNEFADFTFEAFDVPAEHWTTPPQDDDAEKRILEFSRDLDILLVCHGAPRVTDTILAANPQLRMIGELEGDRFAGHVDVAAAKKHNVMVVDTTHSSSWPVSEWALGLMLLGLRQQARFHQIVAGEYMSLKDYGTNPPSRELTGRTVGLIGFGHIAWRLREFLAPFGCSILVYDPYAPREFADAMDVDFTTLDAVMACGITVCLVPQTPSTTGMIGERELDLIPPDGVFVNVSRGVVVKRDALERRAARGDAWFGIDAHDPEPVAVDTPLRTMTNVFLSPHIAGVSVEAQPRFFTLMVDEIVRYRAGSEPRAQLTERVVSGRTS